MTNNLIHITLHSLATAKAHIGEATKLRNNFNSDNILAHKRGNDIINLQKTMQHLAPILHIITETVANREQILVIAQEKSINIQQFPQPILTQKWLHGALSNFKTTKHSKKNILTQLPAAIILLKTTTPQLLLNEAKYLEIPTIALQQTSEDPEKTQYTALTNRNKKETLEIYLQLFAKAAFLGYAKQILTFKKH